ncbi:MAG: pyrroloquinoline quinone biosynthesis protein PqqB [Myxococcota bacterium]
MKVHILGSSAGGGLPQWNCGGPNSVRARRGDPAVPPRTQPSIAVSADGRRWSVLNASPDIRHQLAGFPGLHPRPGTRDVPLDTVVLTNAELDHALGLLVLREALSYRILSTPWVRDAILEHNAAWRLLEPVWGTAKLDEPVALDRDGALEARLFPVPGGVPGYLRGRVANGPESSVGVRLTDAASGRRLVYTPGLKSLDVGTLAELEAADCRFVDGTFFTPDELRRLRPGAPDAVSMGHVPITGEGGSLEPLSKLSGRTLYIHMNNTNPILDAESPEAERVRRAGIEIAADGQEFAV